MQWRITVPDHSSPEQVLRELMNGIADRAWERLHELYAHDAIVEHPFALPSPTRTEGGDAIRQHFASFAAAPLRLEVRNMLVHQTADPEVAIAEWDYDAWSPAPDATFVSRAFRSHAFAGARSLPRATITITRSWLQ
jgi:ketosteroid isomerase-like protein